jgi:hypothetical protein
LKTKKEEIMKKGIILVLLLSLIGCMVVSGACASQYSPEPTNRIIFPNGGEKLIQNQTYQVSWQRENFYSHVAVLLIDYTPGPRYGMQYEITNGVNDRIILGGTNFSWTVPTSIPTGNHYKIIVGIGSDNDFSDNYFSIATPDLTRDDIMNAPIPSPLADYHSVCNGTARLYNLKNGSYSTRSYLTPGCATSGEDCLGVYIADDSIIFGDLNNDGIDDAVAIADNFCGMPASCGKTIFAWVNDNGSPRFVDLIAGYRNIDSLTIKDGVVTVKTSDINDPRFVSYYPAEARYKLFNDCILL